MTPLPDCIASRLIPLDRDLGTLETPAVLVDVDVADRNLARWQARLDALGIANRPHIKTHRSVAFAQRQLELGAKGITCQTVAEAEVMADAGISDILITTNTLGAAKLGRLAQVARRVRLAAVADSRHVVDALSGAVAWAGAELDVMVECDTGGNRCCLADPAEIAGLAEVVARSPGLSFRGLMTYPAPGKRRESAEALEAAIAACRAAGLDPKVVSSGGTPDMWSDEGLGPVTEYRAGTYIYNDRSLVNRGTATVEQCALTVLTTVVSRPRAERAFLDSGSKALTSDLVGQKGYGMLLGYPEAVIYQLSEEHAHVDVSGCARAPEVGERVRVLPNHACVVSNLFDRIHLVSGGRLLGALPVDARGKSI